MSSPRRVAEILSGRVSLEVESIDRPYLYVYVPKLQRSLGVVMFFRARRGEPVASSVLMGRISEALVRAIGAVAQERGIPVVAFATGQHKDDVAKAHLAAFEGAEGVLFVGKAPENVPVYRTEKRMRAGRGIRGSCAARRW